jgi:hypothetical protein
VKMQPLDPDAQGQIFAEVVLPPDMAARRPMVAIDWKDFCAGHSGSSPLAPLLQGYARGSTSAQVLNQTAAALSWIKFLTSQTIIFSTSDSAHSDTLTGLHYYNVVISTAMHDPYEHLLTIKVQVNGSRYTSVAQSVTLTPGACEHTFRIGVDEALGRFVALVFTQFILALVHDTVRSLRGVTLISAGGTSRRLLLVHSVTLKHGSTQASPASAICQSCFVLILCPLSSYATLTLPSAV